MPTTTKLYNLDLTPNAGTTGQIVLLENSVNGTNYVGFSAPVSIASNIVWTLPSTDGTSGQVLATNGAGTLEWSTGGGGATAETLIWMGW